MRRIVVTEFVTLDGMTVSVETLNSDGVRSVGHKEIAHARRVA